MNPIDYWYQKYLKAKLTWEDMKLIIAAEGSIYDEHHGNGSEVFNTYPTEEAFYGEVLRRFNKTRNKE